MGVTLTHQVGYPVSETCMVSGSLDNVGPNSAKDIFLEAVERFPPEEWPKYLDEACGNDVSLREQVDILLAAHQK